MASDPPQDAAHRYLPGAVPIDGYGAGGFRFGGMSHRGSLLGLPSGMHAWSVTEPAGISEESLGLVMAEAELIEILLVGTGRDLVLLPEALRWRLRDLRISADAMPTAAAARTWNVLLAEGRRVAVALIAVD